MKDYIKDKTLKTALRVVESLDDSDEYRDLYAEAVRYRSRDSFEREGDILHVDISGHSPLSSYIEEVESSSLSQKITSNNYSKGLESEGLAEGLYRVFAQSEAERVLLYSDDERYFGPSISGIASMEVIRKMEEERNIDWQTRLDAEEYLWEEAFDQRDQDLWRNQLDQRSRVEE